MAISFGTVAPIFPVRNVRAALEHYAQLGFKAIAYEDPAAGEPYYGFVSRGAVQLHLTLFRELTTAATASACYLYVEDADALYEDWKAARAKGRLLEPKDTPYGLREFAHVDPDGNLIRIGSKLKA
jgi:uncharacterized glyoxalase superfamily protein PhnB